MASARPFMLAFVLGVMAACAKPVGVDRASLDRVGASAVLALCCDAKRKFPPAVTQLVESCAAPIIASIQNLALRPGFLANKPAAQDRILEIAKPLDLFAMSLKGRASGQLSMGYFSHVSIFVGTASDLKAIGIWDDPLVRPWHEELAKEAMVIEAMAPKVRLAGKDIFFDADSLAVLRATGLSKARKRAALLDAFRRIGTPFDVAFNADTDEQVFCTELPARVLPELALPVRRVYDRPIYLPDEAIAHAIQGKVPMKLVGFVVADKNLWSETGENDIAARILAYWP